MNWKNFRKYAKSAKLLTCKELKELGIKAEFEFEGYGFVDPSSEQTIKMNTLVKEGGYHYHTYCCEGNSDYFVDYCARVNRMGYGLAHGPKSPDLSCNLIRIHKTAEHLGSRYLKGLKAKRN